jgi:valyl-tRNA synthetase
MHEISKIYNASEWENKLYKLWEESGYFNPDNLIKDHVIDPDAEPFSIVLPPPNVTGNLHIGHASMLAIEDIMVRYNRMQGKRVLWLPGADHAAIATQSKVENMLHKESGLSRHDIGRETFIKKVEEFAQTSHDTITHQVRKMGSSIDWSREAYTLDENRNLSVRKAFKQMYDEGIIYRGSRTVNWSVKGQSTCSDDEVVHVERNAKLYTFRYWKDFPIAIATTRPETKLGDTAVAVHPKHPKYKQYIGQEFTGEFCGVTLTLKIVADEMADPNFGTGAVGITPSHSHTDYDFWLRHKDEISFGNPVITTDGTIAKHIPVFENLSVIEAREKIVATLAVNDLLISEEDTTQNVGTSDRFGDVIEVLPLRQWFIDVNKIFERDGKKVSLKMLMQNAVRDGGVNIIPERFTKIYFHWIDNLRDWCISRQIWFGHRIPVWYKGEELYCGTEAPTEDGWEQDPDTLDTWFSSGLWTFSTLGWGFDEAKWEREKIYHPTSVLETGYDILFFWVARMILMSEYFLGESPFKKVYLHGLVRDEQGRKMSKSLGNIIDPLDIIPEHGADALRLALVIGSTPGNDIKLGAEKIDSFHNFTNKLWNIGRYVMTQSEATDTDPKALSHADHWICFRLHSVVDEVTRNLENFNFSMAGETLRDFTWNDFADWYVEIHKIEKNDALLRYVFETLLKLWHPFMPFVTEALWQQLHGEKASLLMITSWPKDIAHATHFSGDLATGFGHGTQPLITAIRNIRATYHIDPIKKVTATLITSNSAFLESQKEIIQKLARVETIHILADGNEAPNQCAYNLIENIKLYVHLEGILDVAKEKTRLNKELEQAKNYISRIETQLGNPKFVSQAPEAIILKNKDELQKAGEKIKELENHLENLL